MIVRPRQAAWAKNIVSMNGSVNSGAMKDAAR
jgi:hypothetical protein